MQSTTKNVLTMQLVATARENLDAIPAAPEEMQEVSVSAAIQMLMPTLQKLFKKGYKRPKVVEFLRQQGIDCSEATLKTLYRAPKGRKEKPGKPGEGGSTAELADSPAAPVAPVSPTPITSPKPTPNVPGVDRRVAPTASAATTSSATAKAS